VSAVRATIHPTVQIGKNVRLVAEDLELAEGVRIGDGASLTAGRIQLGPGSVISPGVQVTAVDHFVLGPQGVLGPGMRANGRSLAFGSWWAVGDGRDRSPRWSSATGRRSSTAPT
jgi:UDP-3-O-[3-hydroxymyristoyl] glucosamine N-acyltransferase